LKAGMSVEDVHQRTKIDRWFLHNIRELVEMEDCLRACPGLEHADPDLLVAAKQHGFADRQLAHLWRTLESDVRRGAREKGIEPAFKLLDTSAAEFEAYTPYYYSTYETPVLVEADKETRRQGDKDTGSFSLSPCLLVSLSEDETRPPSGKDRIMILGG